MLEEDANSCVICYETLNSGAFGSTVPCGHLFHQKCFDNWAASCSNRRDLKCPMCNGICNHTTPFVRLFLDLNSLEDNDDISLSSDEEEEDGELPLETEHAKVPEEDGEKPKGSSIEIIEVNEVIEILDDDDNNKTSLQSKDKKKTDRNDELSKYKKKAKKLKRKVKQLEKQRENMVEKVEDMEILEDTLKDVEKQLEETRWNAREDRRLLEVERIELSRTRKELEIIKQKNQECTDKSKAAMEKLKKIQAAYEGDMRKAQSNSMTEVKELNENNRELSSENQRLREAILKHRSNNITISKRNKILEKRLSIQVEETMKDLENDCRKNQKQTVQAYRELHYTREKIEEKASERNNIQMRMKGSANAARMCRNAERKISGKSSAASILDNLDLNAKRQKIELNVKRPTPKRASEARKTSLSKTYLHNRSRQNNEYGNNDIRSLFHKYER